MPDHNRIPDDLRAKVISLLPTLWLAEISRQTGVAPSTIANIAKQAGIKPVKGDPHNKVNRPKPVHMTLNEGPNYRAQAASQRWSPLGAFSIRSYK